MCDSISVRRDAQAVIASDGANSTKEGNSTGERITEIRNSPEKMRQAEEVFREGFWNRNAAVSYINQYVMRNVTNDLYRKELEGYSENIRQLMAVISKAVNDGGNTDDINKFGKICEELPKISETRKGEETIAEDVFFLLQKYGEAPLKEIFPHFTEVCRKTWIFHNQGKVSGSVSNEQIFDAGFSTLKAKNKSFIDILLSEKELKRPGTNRFINLAEAFRSFISASIALPTTLRPVEKDSSETSAPPSSGAKPATLPSPKTKGGQDAVSGTQSPNNSSSSTATVGDIHVHLDGNVLRFIPEVVEKILDCLSGVSNAGQNQHNVTKDNVIKAMRSASTQTPAEDNSNRTDAAQNTPQESTAMGTKTEPDQISGNMKNASTQTAEGNNSERADAAYGFNSFFQSPEADLEQRQGLEVNNSQRAESRFATENAAQNENLREAKVNENNKTESDVITPPNAVLEKARAKLRPVEKKVGESVKTETEFTLVHQKIVGDRGAKSLNTEETGDGQHDSAGTDPGRSTGSNSNMNSNRTDVAQNTPQKNGSAPASTPPVINNKPVSLAARPDQIRPNWNLDYNRFIKAPQKPVI